MPGVFTREQILAEIQRTAAENGGQPLGRDRFLREVGITEYALSQHWARYGDAVRDAGIEPNSLNSALDVGFVLESFVDLTRRLGQVPTRNELRLARARDSSFPSPNVFERLGSRNERIGRALSFCRDKPQYLDVLPILESAYDLAEPAPGLNDRGRSSFGFVYLVRGHRGEYKVGRTNLVDRRLSELGAISAVEQTLIHEIKTDDPVGVEAYWHNRFSPKRMRGEWFHLSSGDVAAFKRWKRLF